MLSRKPIKPCFNIINNPSKLYSKYDQPKLIKKYSDLSKLGDK